MGRRGKKKENRKDPKPNWCLTINSPEPPYDKLFELGADSIRYVIWQIEKVGNLHVQAYIQHTKLISWKVMKERYPTAHIEVAKASYEDNKVYCTKLDSFVEGPWEIGVPMVGGQRSDLLHLKALVDANEPEKVLWQEEFATMIRYWKSIERYRNSIQEKKEWPIIVIVLTGRTNIGKSRFVHEHATSKGPYFKQCNKDWFTGYWGETDVVFDEFYGSRFTYSQLLQILDRYPFTVGTKGGEVNFIPKRIWITSNAQPWEWYPNMTDCQALMRRLTYHRHVEDFEMEFPTEEVEKYLDDLKIYDH